MLRYSLLLLFVCFVSVYSLKDWYKGLCLLIPLLAILERPDMPGSMFGIPGLNPFNVMLMVVILGWAMQKRKENLTWQLPALLNVLLISYFVVVVVAFARLFFSWDEHVESYQALGFTPPNMSSNFIDRFLNVLKWTIPGLLICHGTNSRERYRWVTFAIMAAGFLLALQIVRVMAPALVGSDDLASRALRVLDRDIGYHRVDLSVLMAGVSWAFFLLSTIDQGKWFRYICLGSFFLAMLAMFATGGRGGVLAWLVVGMFVAFIRYRKLLILGPLLLPLIIGFVPGLKERLFEGFDAGPDSLGERYGSVDESGRDTFEISSGRVLVWPMVLDKIEQAPMVGWGMRGYMRKGLIYEVYEVIGHIQHGFNHPHNAYLEFILDSGLIGALPVFIFFFLLMRGAMKGMTKPRDSLEYMVAALLLVFLLPQLVGGLTGQSFYAREGTVLMWCCIGLYLSTRKKGWSLSTTEKPLQEELKGDWRSQFSRDNSAPWRTARRST